MKQLELYKNRRPSLIPSLFEDLLDIDDMFSSFFNSDFFNRDTARIHTADDDKNIYVYVDLPGISKDNVKVGLTDDVLSIDAEEKTDTVHRKFTKRLTLPNTLEFDKADAEFKNGVLKLTFPKKTNGKETRQLKIG